MDRVAVADPSLRVASRDKSKFASAISLLFQSLTIIICAGKLILPSGKNLRTASLTPCWTLLACS